MLSQMTGLRRRFPNKISVRFESEKRDPSGIRTALGRLRRVRVAAREQACAKSSDRDA